MQQRIGQDIDVQLQTIGEFIASAAATSGGVGGIVQTVGGVDQDETSVLLHALEVTGAL